MLYYLFNYLDSFNFPGAGVFNYISFRAAMALITSLIVSIFFGKKIINLLRKQQIGETVRDLGLAGQIEKSGTPTMGGLIILGAILIPTLLFAKLHNIYVITMLLATVWLGMIGFLDDYIKVFKKNNLPLGISVVVTGGKKIGEWISEDTRIPLVSATGSTKMGRELGQKVAARFGKSLLELGGNNAIIVTPSADIALTIRAAVFGAVGTCGQRCTTTRRLIVHDTIYNEIKSKLVKAYEQLNIGNPLNTKNHIGPLIDEQAVQAYLKSLKDAEQQGGKIITKQGIVEGKKSKNYVYPAIVEVSGNLPVVLHETFAPILYLMKYSDLSEAIALQNAVPQGLSSSILTNNLRDMELFLYCKGSDCGIANVNIGTSGAEIGGAFGGEKETGGGRESGSDAWKIYMRRQTNTINYGTDLPLAQGIQFDF